jgi:hypothetical protein
MGLANLKKHFANLVFEITKVDNEIIETPNIAVNELIKRRQRRVDLQKTSEFIQYLIAMKEAEEPTQQTDSKIITMD